MAYVKCPRCELNYMQEGEEMCSICFQELLGLKHSGAARNSAVGIVPSEKFTVKNEYLHFVFDGLKLYNSKDENVGIAFATDNNCPSDGNLEFHFYQQFENKYGSWHRVRVNNVAVPYDFVVKQVSKSGEYSLIVDEWSRYR